MTSPVSKINKFLHLATVSPTCVSQYQDDDQQQYHLESPFGRDVGSARSPLLLKGVGVAVPKTATLGDRQAQNIRALSPKIFQKLGALGITTTTAKTTRTRTAGGPASPTSSDKKSKLSGCCGSPKNNNGSSSPLRRLRQRSRIAALAAVHDDDQDDVTAPLNCGSNDDDDGSAASEVASPRQEHEQQRMAASSSSTNRGKRAPSSPPMSTYVPPPPLSSTLQKQHDSKIRKKNKNRTTDEDEEEDEDHYSLNCASVASDDVSELSTPSILLRGCTGPCSSPRLLSKKDGKRQQQKWQQQKQTQQQQHTQSRRQRPSRQLQLTQLQQLPVPSAAPSPARSTATTSRNSVKFASGATCKVFDKRTTPLEISHLEHVSIEFRPTRMNLATRLEELPAPEWDHHGRRRLEPEEEEEYYSSDEYFDDLLEDDEDDSLDDELFSDDDDDDDNDDDIDFRDHDSDCYSDEDNDFRRGDDDPTNNCEHDEQHEDCGSDNSKQAGHTEVQKCALNHDANEQLNSDLLPFPAFEDDDDYEGFKTLDDLWMPQPTRSGMNGKESDPRTSPVSLLAREKGTADANDEPSSSDFSFSVSSVTKVTPELQEAVDRSVAAVQRMESMLRDTTNAAECPLACDEGGSNADVLEEGPEMVHTKNKKKKSSKKKHRHSSSSSSNKDKKRHEDTKDRRQRKHSSKKDKHRHRSSRSQEGNDEDDIAAVAAVVAAATRIQAQLRGYLGRMNYRVLQLEDELASADMKRHIELAAIESWKRTQLEAIVRDAERQEAERERQEQLREAEIEDAMKELEQLRVEHQSLKTANRRLRDGCDELAKANRLAALQTSALTWCMDPVMQTNASSVMCQSNLNWKQIESNYKDCIDKMEAVRDEMILLGQVEKGASKIMERTLNKMVRQVRNQVGLEDVALFQEVAKLAEDASTTTSVRDEHR